MITDILGGVQFVCSGCAMNAAFYSRQFPDYYGLQYHQDGAFRVEMGSSYARTLTEPCLLITRPGPVFRYGALPGECRLHGFVCFKGPRVDAYIQSGLLPLNPRNPLVRITRPEPFLETLRRLVTLLNPYTAAHDRRAVHTLEDLLLQLHEQPRETAAAHDPLRDAIIALMKRIESQPEQRWDLQSEAKALSMSYPHFRRLFHRHGGMAPWHFVIQSRLRKAAERLIASPLQLKTLAEQCGFDDSLYFSRLFKKYYRLSPLRYRKEFQR